MPVQPCAFHPHLVAVWLIAVWLCVRLNGPHSYPRNDRLDGRFRFSTTTIKSLIISRGFYFQRTNSFAVCHE
ncbi:unnamed protein product, partial [Nesidiocoris tenuis]